MGKYWKLLALYNSETTAYTGAAGLAAPSPYTPKSTGKLVGLRVIVGGDAATTLIELVQFKLTCDLWKPNAIEVMGRGNGLRTAPAPDVREMDFVVDQPIEAGVPIDIEGRNVTADTPVGVSVAVMGCIEN